jgi:hypothetical protein
MAMIPIPSGGKDFEPVPKGTHIARCYRLLHLGTQQVEWQGKKKHQVKILISWELPNALTTPTDEYPEAKPFTMHKRLTLSLDERGALRPLLASWVPELDLNHAEMTGEIDLEELIGRTCMIMVVHEDNPKGGVWSNIGSIMPIPDGIGACPEPVNMPAYLWLDDQGENGDVFEGLSESLQATILKAPESVVWNQNRGIHRTGEQIDGDLDSVMGSATPVSDDEIPF